MTAVFGPSGQGAGPRAFLFDWDNTLVDSWPTIHDALNVTLTAFGKEPWSLDETRSRVRKSMRDSFPKLFGDKWRDAVDVFYERYAAIHVDKLRPIDGAQGMLESLSRTGIYIGVVSNKKGDFLRLEAEHLGWDRFFGAMVGALDADRDKPAADPVDLALATSGIAKGPSVWFAGDADIDMECAYNAGCTPVLVRDPAPRPGEFNAHPPARHFRDCDALCKFINSL